MKNVRKSWFGEDRICSGGWPDHNKNAAGENDASNERETQMLLKNFELEKE